MDIRQKTEGRGQKSEDRSQKTEVRGQKSEDRNQKTEDRRQRTEVRRQKMDEGCLMRECQEKSAMKKHKKDKELLATDSFDIAQDK